MSLSSDKPAARRKIHMPGKVSNVSVRLPFVSIRNRVGIVKTTWTAPYPRDAYKACVGL